MREEKDLRDKQAGENVVISDDKNKKLKLVGIAGAALLVAFLLGFLPMWLSSRGYQEERDQVRQTLRRNVLQNDLATAAINARRGEYELARQQTSDFFTALRGEVDRAENESAFDQPQRDKLQTLLAQRDELITMLARNDTASAERLTDAYFAYIETKNSNAPPQSSPPPQNK